MCTKTEASADCEMNPPLFLSPLVAAGSHQVYLMVGSWAFLRCSPGTSWPFESQSGERTEENGSSSVFTGLFHCGGVADTACCARE